MKSGIKGALIIVLLIVVVSGFIFVYSNVKNKPTEIKQTNIPVPSSSGSSGQVEGSITEIATGIKGEAKILRQGTFNEIDIVHKGSGKAVALETDSGKILKFENFKVTNGPDLFVYISKNVNVEENGLGEFVSLGSLKSSEGEQSYNLPENIEEYKSVAIWCRAFGVLFSEAELK